MKTNATRIICFMMIVFAAFFGVSAKAQTGVLNPDDPIVVYNPSAPPATPAYGTLAKWVKTNRVSFTTTSFKAYFYKGVAFRLKFPKTYKDSLTSNPNKKYPVFVFFHGVGEKGSIYDNEYQLYHGGQKFRDYVDNGQFDGFLLYIQSSSGSGAFNTNHYSSIREIIENYMVPDNKADINRIIVDGLSGGGGASWGMAFEQGKLIAATLPISASSVVNGNSTNVNNLKFTPIWLFQGGLDKAPTPFTSQGVVNAYLAAGGNINYTVFPTEGHGCWNSAWNLSTFVPYMNKAHKANPWPLFGRTEFCPGDPISQVMGLMAGFDGYEWTKDGVLIPGANSNTYTATSIGTYAARIKRGTVWSPWSPTPVVIKLKGATVSPDIITDGFASTVIPSPDGLAGVTLKVPEGFSSYNWQKDGNGTVLSTTNTLLATTAGNYKVKVTEQFGCSSEFSNLFTVTDANAPNGPPAASGFLATAISKTAIKLDWSQNNSPAFNETAFEIYRSESASGPYSLIFKTAADAATYTDSDLLPAVTYFYKIRGINSNAASAVSNPASATTQSDASAPTAPGSLRIASTTRNSVSLIWDESSDDVGVYKYDIFVNGQKFYESEVGQATVFNLQNGQTYVFKVQARDFAGNKSPFSNQITGQALMNGLSYKHYTYTGEWTSLPNFNTLDPVVTGVVPNVTIANRIQNDNFAYLWEGYIKITTAGNYNFRTNSDDGSRLWLGTLNSTVSPYTHTGGSLVNNDGLHGGQDATSGAVALSVGTYPIAIAFYEQGGGEQMTVSWRRGSASYAAIPNSAFQDVAVVDGTAPTVPNTLVATPVSYKQLNLSWTDASNNESGFEIWRSTSATGTFAIVGTTAENATSYSDTVGLAPSTRYFYQIRAIGQYGESAFIPAFGNYTDAQAHWRFNNNGTDGSGNGKNLTANSSPTYVTDAMEPTHATDLSGTNADFTIPSASGDYVRGAYSSKSIVFWMKADERSNNRGVFDIGGADNGIAMRLNSNTLITGIANNNVRISTSTPYTSAAWNHIAVVYSTNTLKLYINGAQVGTTTNLSFSSVGATSNASMIGDENGTTALNTAFNNFDGRFDNFAIFGRALTVAEINAMKDNLYTAATAMTLALPATPAAPSALVASGTSTSTIAVNWNDNSANESSFELYRSGNDASNFILYKALPANTTSFNDTALFSNSTFYYRIRAVNEGGNSAYSNQDSAKTFNNIPVLTSIDNQFMRHSTQLALNLAATDLDPENLTYSFTNLPAFGSFVAGTNGNGVLTFSPVLANVGTYSNITVRITDEHGGFAERSFDLTVNSNDNPVLSVPANAITLAENTTGSLNFSATDANVGDVLTYTFTNLPSFVQPEISASSVQFNLAPSYADNGVYVVGIRVEDGNDGSDTSSVTITVSDVNPNKVIYVNFNDGTINAAAPWNNTGKLPVMNDNFPNLKDDAGVTTATGLQLLTGWNGSNNQGMNTTNNSGIYPDAVLRTSYFTNAVRSVRVYGLNATDKYTFTFLGSRAAPTVGVVTTYAVGAQSVQLNTANNTANTVSIEDLTPAPDGSITFTVANAAGSTFGYLNSLVIHSQFDDGSAPAKARNLTAQPFNGDVRLTWVDAAYNEQSYEVFRSGSIDGTYTLLNPGGNNAGLQLFDDASVPGHTTYFYYVRAVNSYGASISDTVSITTPNAAPVLAPISNVSMSTGQVVNVNVSATDEPGDAIVLQASNLPAFATFTDNGNGTGVVHIAPGNVSGQFLNVTITAIDGSLASSSRQFNISVANASITSVYVNFNQTNPAGAPWNNTNSAPTAGLTKTNLLDNAGIGSGITLSLLDAWTAQTATGYTTGNNSGLYPDVVMINSYYYQSTANRRIQLSGLQADKRYNLIFHASRNNNASPLVTRYTVGAQFVELNAQNNISNTVRINNLTADGAGQLLINAQAVVGPNAYIGALIIESFTPDLNNPVAPLTITAAGISKTQITVNWSTSANTGYEVWRSSTANGTYTKRADIAANTNTFTDNGLTAATAYYYKVKTVLNSNASALSTYAGASTVAYTLNINLNDGTANAPAQGGNWNNTNALIADGFELPNLINDQGMNTGFKFNVVESFSGFNYFGTTTGNNTGYYPDNVLKSFYYNNYADTARLKITNLTLAHAYNFIFLGSRVNPSVGVVTAYKIGNTVVTLNAANNTANVAKISGVLPDADGSVTITIYGTLSGGFGYLNAMSIEGAPSVAPDPNGLTTRVRNPGNTSSMPVAVTPTQPVTVAPNQDTRAIQPTVEQVVGSADAYPNPFRDDITLKFDLKQNVSRFTVEVLDLSGRLIHKREVSNAPAGIFIQKLGLNGQSLKSGVYIVRINGLPGNTSKEIKIIRQ